MINTFVDNDDTFDDSMDRRFILNNKILVTPLTLSITMIIMKLTNEAIEANNTCNMY